MRRLHPKEHRGQPGATRARERGLGLILPWTCRRSQTSCGLGLALLASRTVREYTSAVCSHPVCGPPLWRPRDADTSVMPELPGKAAQWCRVSGVAQSLGAGQLRSRPCRGHCARVPLKPWPRRVAPVPADGPTSHCRGEGGPKHDPAPTPSPRRQPRLHQQRPRGSAHTHVPLGNAARLGSPGHGPEREDQSRLTGSTRGPRG